MFWPACGNVHLRRHLAADLHAPRLVAAALAPDRTCTVVARRRLRPSSTTRNSISLAYLRRCARTFALEFSCRRRCRTGRLEDLDAAVELVRAGRSAARAPAHRSPAPRRLRHVVHLAVGDHDDAGQPVRRRVGERAVEVGEQLVPAAASPVGLRRGDPVHLQIGDAAELGLELAPDGCGLLGPAGDALARALIERRRWRCWRGSRAPPGAASDWRARQQGGEASARSKAPRLRRTSSSATSTTASTAPAQNNGAGSIGEKSIDQLLIVRHPREGEDPSQVSMQMSSFIRR